MPIQIKNQLCRYAARVILCSALAITVAPISAAASSGDSGARIEASFENEEGFRLFKYRTLKALNTLRDLGLTPQAIVETLRVFPHEGAGVEDGGSSLPGVTNIGDAVSSYAGGAVQNITDTVQEETQEIVQEAKDAAADAARRQMNNWVDRIGESIGKAVREAIDHAFGGSEE